MIQYNSEVTKFFKDQGFAYSTFEELSIGLTVYTDAGFLTIVDFMTDDEHWKRWCETENLEYEEGKDNITPMWFGAIDQDGDYRTNSLADRNIGISYNPWLLFKTAEYAEAYNKLQNYWYSPEDFDDYYFDDTFEDIMEES